ncbi:glycosyltransferase family 4 protein [Rhodopirellula europaea]|uniref:glycosyltransferase family 4 protein n=1 Tax=Rhodopirellula europaea TaxID=1263866 RepID=UPI0030ECAB50
MQGRLVQAISLERTPIEQAGFPFCHLPLATRTNCNGDSFWPFRKINSALFRVQQECEYRFSNTLLCHLDQLRVDHGQFTVWLTYTVHHPNLVRRVLQKGGFEYWLLFHGLDLIDGERACQPVGQWVKKAERIVFNSQATQRLYGELGFERNANESVCYPGVDATAALASIEKEPDCIFDKLPTQCRETFIISSVCRLVRRKGLDLAIQGVAELLRTNQDCYFVIAGDGPELQSLKSLVHSMGLEQRVLFPGQVSDAEKFSLLHHSDLFLMPNRCLGGRDFEGFGISFVEAAVAGTCTIGGKHGGACEAIADQTTGFLAETDDAAEAVEKIRLLVADLYRNPSKRIALGQAGKQLALEKFDTSKVIEHLLRETFA